MNKKFPHITDIESIEWDAHPRFPGILMKVLLTPADNALANVSLVRVPPGGEVGQHCHPTQVETIYLLQGQSILSVGEAEMALNAGQIVAIPRGVDHVLRNIGTEPVELMAFFTPPIIEIKKMETE